MIIQMELLSNKSANYMKELYNGNYSKCTKQFRGRIDEISLFITH